MFFMKNIFLNEKKFTLQVIFKRFLSLFSFIKILFKKKIFYSLFLNTFIDLPVNSRFNKTNLIKQ